MLNGGGGLNADGLSLDLQFAADKTLTARKGPTPVFTRGSTGTFVGSNGLIQTAATNIPRFDHTSAGVCRGLLIEESRTNVALYSGALVINTGWGGTLTTVASGTGPDGNAAYELAETTTNTLQSVANTGGTSGSTQATSVTSGVTYTGSIFVKKVTGSVDWVQITHGSAGFGTAQYANINLSNGTIGNSSGGTAKVETYSNGWYRVSWTCAATATVLTNNVIIGCIQNTNGTTRLPTYAGSTSNKLLAAMCQFEVGSFPTSYIPTTTGSVVRSADVCSITAANFTSFYNQSEGTMLAGVTAPGGYGSLLQYIYGISASTGTELLAGYRESSRDIRVATLIASVNQTPSLNGGNLADSSSSKIAIASRQNDFAISQNGSISTTLTGLMPSVDRLFIGNRVGTDRAWNGHIASIRYYKKRLPNAKLAQLTV